MYVHVPPPIRVSVYLCMSAPACLSVHLSQYALHVTRSFSLISWRRFPSAFSASFLAATRSFLCHLSVSLASLRRVSSSSIRWFSSICPIIEKKKQLVYLSFGQYVENRVSVAFPSLFCFPPLFCFVTLLHCACIYTCLTDNTAQDTYICLSYSTSWEIRSWRYYGQSRSGLIGKWIESLLLDLTLFALSSFIRHEFNRGSKVIDLRTQWGIPRTIAEWDWKMWVGAWTKEAHRDKLNWERLVGKLR